MGYPGRCSGGSRKLEHRGDRCRGLSEWGGQKESKHGVPLRRVSIHVIDIRRVSRIVDTLLDYACVRSVTRDHRLYAGLSSVSILSDQATPDSDEKETFVCTHIEGQLAMAANISVDF